MSDLGGGDFLGNDRRKHITVLQVAQMWNVSTDKVYAAIRKGSLTAYSVDGSIRIRLADAQDFGRPLGAPSTGAA